MEFLRKTKEKMNEVKATELKSLFFLGLLCLTYLVAIIFLNQSEVNTIDVMMRSQLMIIFGYIYSLQTRCEMNKGEEKVKFIIAFIIAFLSIIILSIARFGDFTNAAPAIATVRDLLATSIGFIIGRAKKIE